MGASFQPQQGHFKWYKSTWQTEDAELTGVAHLDALRVRVCVHDVGGKAKNNAPVGLEYSTTSDFSSDVNTVGNQGATDKAFRFRDDGSLTNHATIDQARLTCTTENGMVHENDGAEVGEDDFGASAHHELSLIIEPYNPTGNTTYYFRVTVNGTQLPKDSEVSDYAYCTTAAGATTHEIYKNSDARIKAEQESSKLSDARIKAEQEFTKYSDAKIYVEGVSTKTIYMYSDARIHKTQETTKNADARVKKTQYLKHKYWA